MAIVMMQDPANVSALHGTREPIVVRVRGTEYVLEAPVFASSNTLFNTLPSVGNTLLISLGSQTTTITFVAIGGPRVLGTQCFAAAGGESIADFLNNKLIPVLRENPLLNMCEFSVNGPSSLLNMTTVEEMNLPISLSATGFSINASGNPGANGNFRDDYFIRMCVHITTNQQGTIYTLRSPWQYFKPTVNASGQAVVEQDISSIIEEMMVNEDDLWNENDVSVARVNLSARKCFVKVQEYYPGSLGTSGQTLTGVWRAIKGGREAFARAQSISTSYSRKFLTNRENVYTDARMIDWLYFIVPNKAANNTFRVQITTIELGTEMTWLLPLSFGNWEVGTIVKIPAGYKQLGAHNTVPSPVRYIVSIVEVSTSNVVVDTVCSIDFNLLPESDFVSSLQYYNSFGLLESILLEGSVNVIREWNKKFEYVDMPTNPQKEDHPELSYDVMQDLTFECATGPLSKQSWSAAGDVMLSKKHYWADVMGKNARHAVVLEKGKAEIGAYNTDGNAYATIPLKLRFPVTRNNSIPIEIIDL